MKNAYLVPKASKIPAMKTYSTLKKQGSLFLIKNISEGIKYN
jgi:hypothetical protein